MCDENFLCRKPRFCLVFIYNVCNKQGEDKLPTGSCSSVNSNATQRLIPALSLLLIQEVQFSAYGERMWATMRENVPSDKILTNRETRLIR